MSSSGRQREDINIVSSSKGGRALRSASGLHGAASISSSSVSSIKDSGNLKVGKDNISISPLADKLSKEQNLNAVKGSLSNNGLSDYSAGLEGAMAPQEITKTIQAPENNQEVSSDVPLAKPAGGKDGYWDQLLVMDSMLVLQERLGGMNASNLSLGNGAGTGNGKGMSQFIYGNDSSGNGTVSPLGVVGALSQGMSSRGSSNVSQENLGGTAVFRLVKDLQEAQASGADLQDSTKQLVMLAMKNAGVDSGNLNFGSSPNNSQINALGERKKPGSFKAESVA